MNCIDANTVQMFVSGRLEKAGEDHVRRHIEGCAECRHLVAAAIKFEHVSGTEENGVRPSSPFSTPLSNLGSTHGWLDPDYFSSLLEPVGEINQNLHGSETRPYGDLIGKFKIIRKIGEGGMGQVYLARDTELGRRVALKLIHPRRIGSDQDRQRLMLEARTTARFNHPRIITIYEVGQQDGSLYLALEYLEGETLRQRLFRAPLPLIEAVRIGHAIADALAEAHRNQVLHRDLKPENVFLCEDGRIRVLDFGLAARADTGSSDLSTPGDAGGVAAGSVKGTLPYLAPEQWTKGQCSDKSDTWSLGIILHELLAGNHPFDCSSLDLLCRQVTAVNPTPPLLGEGVPVSLAKLIQRCLSGDLDSRPSSAEAERQLGQQLTEFQGFPSREQCPFLGLSSFTERRAHSYFGRVAEIYALVHRLGDQPLVPVIGASGVGKSSLVAAGLIPRLREQGNLRVIAVRPGARPFLALAWQLWRAETDEGIQPVDSVLVGIAEELAESPPRLALRLQALAESQRTAVLLFIDQLEEVFSLVPSEAVRRRFLETIAAAVDEPWAPVRVVIAMREEFLSRLAMIPELQRAMGSSVVLGVPQASDLEQILVQQASAAGYRYDEGLAEEMAASVSGTPAGLPLLQFCGERLWELRDVKRRLFTRTSYEEMGRIGGALARHADGVLAGLSDTEVRSARILLLRLVTAESTRRVLSGERLLEGLPPEARGILARLIDARLLSALRRGAEAFGDPDHLPISPAASGAPALESLEIELVHESLVTEWSTLAEWITESNEDLRALRELEAAATLWVKRGRPESEAWRGDALRDGQRVTRRLGSETPDQVRSFIATGVALEQRKRRQRRALLLLSFLMLGGAALFFFLQEREMFRQKEREAGARAQALEEGAWSAMSREDRSTATAKLRRSLEIADTPGARILWGQLQRMDKIWHHSFGKIFRTTAWSPDGRVLALSLNPNVIYLIDSESWQIQDILRGSQKAPYWMTFSQDGKYLATNCDDRAVQLWDLDRRQLRYALAPLGEKVPGHLVFCDEGRLLARVSGKQEIQLITASTGRVQGVLRAARGTIRHLATDKEGQVLAAATTAGEVLLWRVSTREMIRTVRQHGSPFVRVALGPEGRQLITGDERGKVALWELTSKTPGAPVMNIPGTWSSLTMSLDGKRFAVASEMSGEIQVWDTRRRSITATYAGEKNTFILIRFAPGGERIVASRLNGVATVWRIHGSHEAPGAPTHGSPIMAVATSPDGQHIATAGLNGSLLLWEVATGERREVHPPSGKLMTTVRFSPDGRLIAVGGEHTLLWYDMLAGKARVAKEKITTAILDISFSPDGRRISTVTFDELQLWDAATTDLIYRAKKREVLPRSVAFTSDGKHLALGGRDKQVHLLDARDGRELRVLGKYAGRINGLALSPDDSWLYTADDSGLLARKGLAGGALTEIGRPATRLFALSHHWRAGLIGTCGTDGKAAIYPASSEVIALRGHRGDVNDLAFSPDGASAATVGDDQTLRLWDVTTGRPRWRAPLLVGAPPTLLTHRGWEALERGSRARPAPASHWRRAVEQRGLAAVLGGDGRLLCMSLLPSGLEVWDAHEDKLLLTLPKSHPKLTQLPRGCATIAEGEASLIQAAGRVTRLPTQDARAIAAAGEEFLVADSKEVIAYSGSGVRRGVVAHVSEGVTSLLRVDEHRLLVGYQDGSLEVLSMSPDREARAEKLIFQDTPAGAPLRLRSLSGSVVVAGFGDGTVGIWDLHSGKRLQLWRLHGPVVHLLYEDGVLYAATELGDHGRWEMNSLTADYCRLLREVWREVPVTWENGRPRRRAAPPDHRCATSPQGVIAGQR